MMAMNEDRETGLPARLGFPALCMLLGFAATFALVVNGQLAMNTFWGPNGRQATEAFLLNVLIVGAIWGMSWLRSSKPRILVQLLLLAFAAFMVTGALIAVLKNMHARNFAGLWYWKTLCLLGGNLLVIAGAIWGMWIIRPWQALRRSAEVVSPATLRTKLLFGLAGVVSVLAVAVVIFGTSHSDGNPVWSNSENIRPVVAFVAIVFWLASIGLSWWWYYSADEHERRANDVGFLIGGGLFMAVTPVWWLLYRAGIAPPPDAMVLWYITIVAMGIGWWWRRR